MAERKVLALSCDCVGELPQESGDPEYPVQITNKDEKYRWRHQYITAIPDNPRRYPRPSGDPVPYYFTHRYIKDSYPISRPY